jgi:hypothetical protein
VRLLSEAKCQNAASRRPGPSRTSTQLLSSATHNGQALAYVYFENEPGRRSAAKLLERDEARRIAANDVTSLQHSEQFNRPPLVGPCLHTIRNQDLIVPFEGLRMG